MPLLSHLLKRRSPQTGEAPSFPLVLLEKAREEGDYAVWIKNHRWNRRNEKWCRTQVEKFLYKPTISILMQCKNPREDFLIASFASAFNQIYSFHEFFVVDRGSTDPKIRELLEKIEQDPRVKVSFQKGTERDITAIAKIMKKTESEWILMMTAEDVLEPYTLYNMVGALQDTVDIDFVFSDSDLIDDQSLRFAPQFKPVWAVGAHYPLGYYQHPVLLHERLVKKLNGHERISQLMEEGALLDEASNHSRFVVQAPGILYHGRNRGSKNETPPEPVHNVLMNENFVYEEGRVRISPFLRIQAEPRMPLRVLWLIDRMDLSEASQISFYLSRFLKKEWQHAVTFVTPSEQTAVESFREIGEVSFVKADDLPGWISANKRFDAAFVSSDGLSNNPEILHSLDIPHVWQIRERPDPQQATHLFDLPETILFSSTSVLQHYKEIDRRRISRILLPTVDVADIKLFTQQNSPFKIREELGISMNTVVVNIIDPTIEQKSQHTFVEAALKILADHPETDVRFFVVGARAGKYLETLRGMIPPNNNKVTIVQEESRFEKSYPYYFISDVCVSCSLEEVFPLTTLKAMAFKKAVLATDVFASNEVIQNGWNGYLFRPEDSEELSVRMLELIRNTPDRDMMARRSLEMAREKFDLRKVGATLERYLRESIVYVD